MPRDITKGAPDRHRTAGMKSDLWLTVDTCGALRCVRFPSRGRQRIVWTTMIARITIAWIFIGRHRQDVKEPKIAVRSSRDHTSFVGGSSSSIGRRSTKDQDHDRGPIAARSWRDRDPIVARSWPDRGGNRGDLEAKLKPWPSPICRGIEATIHAQGIAPSTSSNRLHNHLNCPPSSGQISL